MTDQTNTAERAESVVKADAPQTGEPARAEEEELVVTEAPRGYFAPTALVLIGQMIADLADLRECVAEASNDNCRMAATALICEKEIAWFNLARQETRTAEASARIAREFMRDNLERQVKAGARLFGGVVAGMMRAVISSALRGVPRRGGPLAPPFTRAAPAH